MSETSTDKTVELDEELSSFTVSIQRTYERDYSEAELQRFLTHTEAETSEEAIAEVIAKLETQEITPMQKLIELKVDVDGPSND